MTSPARTDAHFPAGATRVRINEIFFSLQGEARTVGFPTVFVRLTGCPLRCGYCDTAYAFTEGGWMSLDDVLQSVGRYSPRHVTATGGEPLAQPACRELLQQLCDIGYQVSLETSGALDISGIDPRVSIVMDLKTPGSGEQASNRYANIDLLRSNDQLKFVIADRADYDWSRDMIRQHAIADRCEILFSPVYEKLNPTQLADWILADRAPVRMQVQLHKILWGDARGK